MTVNAGKPEGIARPALPVKRSILGVDVMPMTQREAIDFLGDRIRTGTFTRIAFLNAHVANLATGDTAFKETLRDFVVFPDGIGVDIASSVLHGDPFPANLNGTDFVPAFIAAQTAPLRIGLIGTTRVNVELAASHLRAFAPRHEVVMVQDGYFSDAEEPGILARLEAVRPDILLVALGVPRQERWIARNLTDRHCTVVLGVGALLDFMSGTIPRAPLGLRRLGLEWLFRLFVEPMRLWRRYVLGNPLFLMRVLGRKLSRSKDER
ncbi:glycosyltransferase [Aquibium carbonis]|uniref:Glycosyltransferase n=1 Tax=Aquibium carbonis TaxID=2495581 RepID=A0A429Z0A0_9HYPH|nr:WecB/TagA/CpsF family glycosyltransferase [Aquibium carbonis]RST87074.1 glycosyltransferase [Aquibium carbonis]